MPEELPIYEAFVPSGTEGPDTRVGFYAGEITEIKKFVATQTWVKNPTMVTLVLIEPVYVYPDATENLIQAKKAYDEARERLRSLGYKGV